MTEELRPKPPKKQSRKKFLKTLGLGSLLLISSGVLYFNFWAYEKPPESVENLGPMEYSLVKQMSRIFYPANNPIGVSAADINVPQRIDEQFSQFPQELKDQMHLLLLAIELSTVLSRYVRPFSHLSEAQQIAVLKSWEHSTSSIYRMLVKGSKLLFGLAYFSHEKVKKAMGYKPLCAGLA